MSDYQELIKEINNVRKDPSSFADKLLGCQQYFTGNILRMPGLSPVETQEGFAAFEEAAKFLKEKKPIPELAPSKGLGKIAADFSTEISHCDPEKIGDIDLNSIIKKYGSYSGNFTSAIDFGSSTPESVVINLFVSDGDPSRGNREFLIEDNLLKIGIASGKHDTYGYLTIIVSCQEFENTDKSDDTETFGKEPTPIPPTTTPASEPNKTESNVDSSQPKTEVPAVQAQEKPPQEKKDEDDDDFLRNDPDVLSWDKRERLCIERGKKKRKIIYYIKYKNGISKKKAKYIVL